MIQITPQQKLILAVDAIDCRKGIDGLIGLCRKYFGDPFSGTVFAFRNQKGTSVKLLVYDGTGAWLCTKRFSAGKLRYWPRSPDEIVCATNMMIILNQGSPVSLGSSWRRLPSSEP
jgi:transposase